MSNERRRPSAPVIGLGILVAAIALTGVGVAASGAADKSKPSSLNAGQPSPVSSSEPVPSATTRAPSTAAEGTVEATTAPVVPSGAGPVSTPPVTGGASPTVMPSATGRSAGPSAAPATTSAPGRAAAKPRASAKPSDGASTKSSAASTTAATAPDASSSAGAAAGSYTENTTGTVSYTGGSMPVNGTATLKVDAAQGQAQTQTVSSGNSSQVEKLVFGSNRVDATEISITSPVLDSDFVLSPQEPLTELTPGATWSWKADSTDGKEHLALSGSYAGTEQVMIDGKSEPAAIIKSTLTVTGSIATTITQTDDYDPAYKLVLREHAIAKGTYSGINYTSDSTTTLSSLTPS